MSLSRNEISNAMTGFSWGFTVTQLPHRKILSMQNLLGSPKYRTNVENDAWVKALKSKSQPSQQVTSTSVYDVDSLRKLFNDLTPYFAQVEKRKRALRPGG